MAIQNLGPQDRRRAFVNRLYSQYRGASQQPSPGVGTPFHGGFRSAPMLHTQSTQSDNVPVNLQGLLGPGGFGRALAGERSGSANTGIAPQSGVSMPLPGPVHLPLPGQAGQPAPASTPSSPTPVSPQSPASILPGQPGSAFQVGTDPSQPNALTARVEGMVPDSNMTTIPGDAIPLGNGSFWSPTAGLISTGSGPQSSLGGAITSLPKGAPTQSSPI